ncbi:proteasome component ECM29 [Metarhizium album ARSEF 1941]|uniref:Proteasome component ECM29 n=1 Tax=Metarhizium album (strain ARSEF 1941) TaxID=1081103 RepID=A0A0B2WY04_METAS|nr:proteasome component ECM29 [Metarhizium album ARSEF 1941]KHN98933.1 proteasome component ECM29 [Metarhizium album ARSEF 1941]
MAATSTEQRELQLVESVEFKILGVANKEDKLNQLLQRYLVPLILKAASDHAAVRARVIQILARLKTFIQSPEIVLPVKALLQQYKSTDSGVIKQLDLSFILHSLDRLDVDDRRNLVSVALAGFALDEGQPRAATMFNIVLRLLLDFRIPPRGSKDDETLRTAIGLGDDADAQSLARAIGIFLRLRTPSNSGQNLAQSNPALSRTELSLFPAESPENEKIFKRTTELKSKLVTLLASGAFKDEERFLPALFAAAGPDNRVASTAEEIIKRSTVSMEDADLVQRLFRAHSHLPAPYRARILSILSKSTLATEKSDSIMAVVKLDFLPQTADSTSSLQPASVLERTKLHKALFQFLSWVAQVGPARSEFTIGPALIRAMRSYIESQGWPVPEQASHDDVALRSRAYETIGMVARSADLPAKERFDLGAWLFRSLSEDNTGEAVVNIDGALSSLAAAISPSVGGADSELKKMLLTYMSLPDAAPAVRSTRHAAVKWANQCLPFSDVVARWICILAIAGRNNERNDVIEQGQKGLDPWTYFAHTDTSPQLPDWKEMMTTYFGLAIEPHLRNEQQGNSHSVVVPDKAVFQNFQGSRLAAFPVALQYCKKMMLLAALHDFDIKPDWMQILDAQITTDVATRDRARGYLRSVDSGYIVFYLKACLEGAFIEGSSIVEECLRCFVQMATWSPGGPLGYLTDTSTNLLPLIKSNNREIRSLAARALGVLVAHPANDADSVSHWAMALQSSFANAESLVGTEANAAEGSLLAFSHLISRSVYYDRPFSAPTEYPFHLLVKEAVHKSLNDSALEAFSQLWVAKLAIPPMEGEHSLAKVIEKLTSEAKKANEKAIRALGSLATGLEADGSNQAGGDAFTGALGDILKSLFSLHEIKRVEVQFTVGDAITAAVARWDSNSVKLRMDVEARNPASFAGARGPLIEAALKKLLQDAKATKPSLLKASGIWLFSIVQFSSHLSEVQSRLREIQAAFMRLLSARDELVQETASRGLSLVYERGDAELKSALVKDLVSAFTGSGTQLKVEEETELFDPGALPTGEGNSVTSYKDIVNLANEVGDQRLVYKFMSLAANAATWSTRSAFGRFGLSDILSESEVDPKLFPKLYRYRFDPNGNVQRSMDDIWKALVKDSNATIDHHFDAIIQDLLRSILGREWRVREASCAAISDLIQGRPFRQYEEYYREVWTSALKVLDDVKGSVREAASRLCMALSNGLVRQLEEGNHAVAAKAMMQEALPFLLSDKGIESTVQDVQLFATVTVMKIAKHGGNALKPFIPDMIPRLLGLLSTIEPQQINYAYQRAGLESRDQIDKIRSQMVNQSPISEAIENCLRFVDPEVMTNFAPKFEATIKNAIGMPTKIGCSRVITTLATRHSNDTQPVAAKLLQILEKQTMDKNDEVSQAYARASAYMIRAAPDASKVRFCERYVDMYFRAEDESRRQKVADVIVAVAKVSPDHFTAQETQLLPFAYLGSHDTDEYTGKVFQEVWNQHAGSSRTVTRYVREIVGLAERCLETPQWAIRHTGAFTVAAMVADVANASEVTGAIDEANLKAIWPLFDKTLALKTFPGKEKLLDSYPLFVERGETLWDKDSVVSVQMKKIAIREAKRNNDEYRPFAFRCLWKFAKARPDLDMLKEIADITLPYLEEQQDEDKMDVDSKENKKEDLDSKTARNAFEAIARGYSRSKTIDIRVSLVDVMRILKPHLASARFDFIKREIWYECVHDLMVDAAKFTDIMDSPRLPSEGSGILAAYTASLDVDRGETGTESQRAQRVQALSKILDARSRGVFGKADLPGSLENDVKSALEEERSIDVQRAWREVLGQIHQAQS